MNCVFEKAEDEVLNEFESTGAMVQAGWEFSWDDEYMFWPETYCDGVPNTSYCGFR